ncbi:MAG TPA: MBL fold metallo-hydrolase [Bacillota bacterium]|nr:MBL fold metallo-hydrolase [Bacillota bacterium]
MNIKQLSLGPLGTNGYVVSKDSYALIIDPGGDPEKMIAYITEEKLKPQAILLTHAHFDHIGGLEAIRNHYQIDVYIHELEKKWLVDPDLNGSSRFMLGKIVAEPADKVISIGTKRIEPFEFEVIHTPGHSPGSISFIFKNEPFILSGDVLFQEGIGRTDLPGGDMKTLENSIMNKLYRLSEEMIVYPGHGEKTTIGYEKNNNPFFRV